MLRSIPVILLLLAGCGERGDEQPGRDGNAAAPPAAAAPAVETVDGKAECAPNGATSFERVCTIEHGDSREGRVITLRAPDGGFRRLLITRDGHGVVAADGAEPARVTVISPDRIEVAVGEDRYRLPAAIRR